MMCVVSRYTLVASLQSLKSPHLMDVFSANWFRSLGKPSGVISDRGAHVAGPGRNDLANTFEIERVMGRSYNPNENRLVERGISLIAIGFNSIRNTIDRLSFFALRLGLPWQKNYPR